MSESLWGALIPSAVLLLLAGLGVAVMRSRGESARLRRRLEAASMELERLQVSFSRFAPEQVIEKIIASGIPTSGEKKEVTILFADLVGFTRLSESVKPTELVRILNGYFECMTQAIREHGGYVSTLVGDGILALFGALEPNPWQGDDGVRAALAMRRELENYNRTLDGQGIAPLALGLGLHRGTGVAGLVGSMDLMEFTVVGRTINLAARIQDLTRLHSADIIISQAIQAELDPRFACTPLPAASVKGIEGEVEIFAVEGFSG